MHRREVRKVITSETTGIGTSQVYTPRLRYFEHMAFLEEKEYAKRGLETVEDDDRNEDEDIVSTIILILFLSCGPEMAPAPLC
ncbi:hypothetical protein PR048_019552 [Dryococelus australis]|uniref:Uncharacterized protein n=1 Tax=Dryococelus australis TaxID=614101 RepID=A0ABQ9H449_9NEOP|nr:hypothetical protein PR048_019552 [Dryococelus australis]